MVVMYQLIFGFTTLPVPKIIGKCTRRLHGLSADFHESVYYITALSDIGRIAKKLWQFLGSRSGSCRKSVSVVTRFSGGTPSLNGPKPTSPSKFVIFEDQPDHFLISADM